MLLDRDGVVQFSSAPLASTGDFRPDSPTCQACHQFPAAQRMDSRVIETRGGAVLRTVIPIRTSRNATSATTPPTASTAS